MAQNNLLRRVLCIAMFFAVLLPLSLSGNIEQQRKQRSALQRDIAILKKQISGVSAKSSEALSQLSLIKAQEEVRRKMIADTDLKIKGLQRQIDSASRGIAYQQSVLDTLEAHYRRLVAGAYRNRDVKKWYMYILGSESVSQAFRRFGYFKNLSSQINSNARKIEEVKASLMSKKEVLTSLKKEALQVKKQKAAELASLKEEQKKQEELITSLKKDSKAFKAALNAKKKEMVEIDKRIQKMLREEAERNARRGKGKNRHVDYELARRFEQNKGKLPWPVDGPVAEHFGPYRNERLNISLVNNGINIACEEGCKVKAVFDGVVSNVMLAPGYGHCILIQHGDYYTSYCKVKTTNVHKGDKVKTGQIIGEVATIMGKTQLYFLIYNKEYIDPEAWLCE